jgi:cell filamentation protein, protein adenylyltransferase
MVPARTINAVPAPDRLPQPLRHCVDQTIAAEALEGWRPTAEQVDALVALVNGDVTFADYLAAYQSRYPAKPTGETDRRTRRRSPPYLIPGTTVLRNNFGADTHETLTDLEFVATAGRIAGWHRRLADGDVGADDLDVRAIHRQLFADVYGWAGDFRVTDLRLGDDVFARRASVQRRAARVEGTARALVVDDAANRDDALPAQLARLYAEYNYVHPFREGNGRTGTMMLHIVTTLRGRRLDLGTISREEWYTASHDSMPLRSGGTARHLPFVGLFVRALD